MSAKYLNISHLVALVVALVGMQSSAYGTGRECYPTIETYMIKTFGEHYADDENLVVSKRTYGRQNFYIATDMTPGTNHSEVLFNKTEGNRFCIVLSTSMMAKLTAVKFDARGYPREFVSIDQAPPGMPEQEIIYRPNAERTAFHAAVCEEITFKEKKQLKKAVPCSNFLAP